MMYKESELSDTYVGLPEHFPSCKVMDAKYGNCNEAKDHRNEDVGPRWEGSKGPCRAAETEWGCYE